MKFRNNWNSNEFPQHAETNREASKTVPDQSLSIQQILTRYATGQPLGNQKSPIYYGDEVTVPEMEKLDLSERYDLIKENRQKIESLKREIHRANTLPVKQVTPLDTSKTETGAPSAPIIS